MRKENKRVSISGEKAISTYMIEGPGVEKLVATCELMRAVKRALPIPGQPKQCNNARVSNH